MSRAKENAEIIGSVVRDMHRAAAGLPVGRPEPDTEQAECADCGLSGPADELTHNLCPMCAQAEQKSAGENLNWRGSC